jgi:DNA-binding Lrp family transcriptional regulator
MMHGHLLVFGNMQLVSQIDKTDVKILIALLNDARRKLTDIAEECDLSSTAVRNRINKMKKKGIIIKPVLNLNMPFFGYEIPLLIGVNLEYGQENKIINFVKSHVKVAGIDQTIGKYDLCLFVFAESVSKLDDLKNLVKKQQGVKKIEVNLWSKFHLNFDHIDFIEKKEP